MLGQSWTTRPGTANSVEVTGEDPSAGNASIAVTVPISDVDLGELGNGYDADGTENRSGRSVNDHRPYFASRFVLITTAGTLV